MTAYLAGIAAIRCFEHDRADELNATTRMTLIAMATFASERTDPPVCTASQASIADRAGLADRATRSALVRLEKLGIIERLGTNGRGSGFTVRWGLSLLARSSPARDADLGRHDMPRTPARGAEESPARGADNPSVFSRGSYRGRRTEDRSEERTASAGAPAARPPSTEGPTPALLGAVMQQLGKTEPQARQWIEEKLAAANGSVRNPDAYIRRCLNRWTPDDPPEPPIELNIT